MTAQTYEIDLAALTKARKDRVAAIKRASAAVRKAEAAYERCVAERDGLLIECHGDKRQGFLSYEELAQATGRADDERISKGRVIQIVQGKSEYSKRQRPVVEE